MSHYWRMVNATLVLALSGCFQSTPLDNDANGQLNSTESATETASAEAALTDQTDSLTQNSTEKATETASAEAAPTDQSDSLPQNSTESATETASAEAALTDQTDSTAQNTDTVTDVLRMPVNHRSVDEACDSVRLMSSEPGSTGEGSTCTVHADCTEGENGRCEPEDVWAGWPYVCTYDACYADSDCDAGVVCYCGGDYDANRCLLAGNCRTDADCGPEGYCSPSVGSYWYGIDAYYCHTPEDECVDDTDCQGGDYNWCRYNEIVGRWTCDAEACCIG